MTSPVATEAGPVAGALALVAADYVPSTLHGADRCWTETNCYIDVWIEVLHALGLPAQAIGVSSLSADFEGEQWVFFKVPPEDLRLLFGIEVHEMNVFRPLSVHVAEQLRAGRLLTIEVDSFFLPDTLGTAYRQEHVKTTIVPAMIDPAGRRLGYFHSSGYYELAAEDYDGIFTPALLPPYVEIVRLEALERDPARHREAARTLIGEHLKRAPRDNPIARMAERIAADLPLLSEEGISFFHTYAFATARQCGASAEMAASFLRWFEAVDGAPLAEAADALDQVANAAKSLELTMARVAAGRRGDLQEAIAAMTADWDRALALVRSRYG